jgi:hypothetical protein
MHEIGAGRLSDTMGGGAYYIGNLSQTGSGAPLRYLAWDLRGSFFEFDRRTPPIVWPVQAAERTDVSQLTLIRARS